MVGWVKGVAALAVGVAAAVVPVAAHHGDHPSAASVALARLDRDATDGVRHPAKQGRLTWLGTPAGGEVRNPDVSPTSSPDDAARAHVRRYGAAFGVPEGDSDLTVVQRHRVAGSTVTIFQQSVDGVPVLASGLSVETAPDGQLRSMLVDVSQASSVAAPTFAEDRAEKVAVRFVRDRHATPGARLHVERTGRTIYDPAVIGAEASAGRHAVWGFTVSAGPALTRSILVDDRTGGIVADLDRSETIDRVVCDNANVLQSWMTSCDSGFARTEGGAATGVLDVDRAYDELGAVSAFYASVAGIDLTALLGRNLATGRSLSATVRYCEPGSSCPMANAYWFNQQMYTGNGFAIDDIVGHEMTHGVIEKYASLFYWGQSGAINEGLADVMGEQVDRRLALPGEPADAWLLGEQAPGGAIRSLADPAAAPYYQPDRTGSARYSTNPNDNGGVHTNSGIVLKTFYLTSQGGTFNGHTVAGIDGADASTTKSATLWWQALQRLVPGSDFADLGHVLDQACTALVGTLGFTAADCTQVHEAGLATQLTTTPANAPQPADAPRDCPTGRVARVLLSSESNPFAFHPAAAGSGWTRADDPNWGPNAFSGHDAWHNPGQSVRTTDSLVAAAPVALPAGQASYLRFQQWRYLDAEPGWIYDAGTVELADSYYGPLLGESLPASSWVNGPTDTISTGQGNPFQGRKGFGADSRGWVASRLDLSFAAGRSITPQLTLSTDQMYAFLPWFLDDIEIYTCDAAVSPTASPSVTASPTASASPTTSATPTATPSATATVTATPTPTATAQPSASATPTGGSPTPTPTPTATTSSTPTATGTPTSSPAPSTSPTSSPVAPGAPTAFTVQPAASALAVTLRWSPPTTSGSGVTGYRVTRSDGAIWIYPVAGSVIHGVPGTTTMTYTIRTLGKGGTTSGAVSRVVSARRLSLGALPTSVTAGTTLTMSGLLTRLPDGAVLSGQVVTVQYLRAGTSTWRTLTTSTGAAVRASSSSTGRVVARIHALRGTVSYRFFAAGFRGTSRSWLRAWSPARKVAGS